MAQTFYQMHGAADTERFAYRIIQSWDLQMIQETKIGNYSIQFNLIIVMLPDE